DCDDDQFAVGRDLSAVVPCRTPGLREPRDRLRIAVEPDDRKALVHEMTRDREAHLAEPDDADARDVASSHCRPLGTTAPAAWSGSLTAAWIPWRQRPRQKRDRLQSRYRDENTRA